MDRASKLAISIAAVLSVGCAGTPAQISTLSAEELAAYPPSQRINLCNAYHIFPSDRLKAELEKSNPDFSWGNVDNSIIVSGMDMCEVLAARGNPNRTFVDSQGRTVWTWSTCYSTTCGIFRAYFKGATVVYATSRNI